MSIDPNDMNVNPLGEILQEEPPPEEPKPKPNRSFTLIIVILSILTLGALLFLLFVAPNMVKSNQVKAQETAAVIYAANTATSVIATTQAYEGMLQQTPSQTPQPSPTLAPTNTPLLAQPSASPTSLISACRPGDHCHSGCNAHPGGWYQNR